MRLVMVDRWRSRGDRDCAESGFSLIEMLVAMLVLGIILTGLASTIVYSLRAAAANQREVRATALHTEIIERFQALDWDLVGVYVDDPGYETSVTEGGMSTDPIDADVDGFDDKFTDGNGDPYPVVSLGNRGSEEGELVPAIVQARGEGELKYLIETHVFFVDREGLNDPDKETKRIVTIVRWRDVDGSVRETQVTAERSPPGKAVGFVPESNDRDNDGVADSDDNCPSLANSDQTDTNNNGIGDACEGDLGIGDVEVISVKVFKENNQGNWVLLGTKFCVGHNDALSSDHRVEVNTRGVTKSDGAVDVTYGYWKGTEDDTNPPNEVTRKAAFTSGTNSSAFWDLVIAENTGKLRRGKTTTVTTSAFRPSDSTSSDPLSINVSIERC